jgi:hypothetical protein
MRARTLATAVATLALIASIAVAVVVATPSLSVALLTPHLEAAPTSTFRPHVAPTATSTPSATPIATYSGPLVGARGSMPITRAQLHAWLVSRPSSGGDTRIWEAETWLDIRCMARKGFLEDPTNPSVQMREIGEGDGLTKRQLAAYEAALYGPPTDAPYDWRTAGCHGRSVHLMGQDDAH